LIFWIIDVLGQDECENSTIGELIVHGILLANLFKFFILLLKNGPIKVKVQSRKIPYIKI